MIVGISFEYAILERCVSFSRIIAGKTNGTTSVICRISIEYAVYEHRLASACMHCCPSETALCPIAVETAAGYGDIA